MVHYSSRCTSCLACVLTCPLDCISLNENNRIIVNEERCVKCGRCDSVCQLNNHQQLFTAKNAIACVVKDTKLYYDSSSGGVASLLIKGFLESGGVVFCAIYNEHLVPTIVQLSDISMLSGSIYSYSDTSNSFYECKSRLDKGENVLFLGLPCQIGGLRNYLKSSYEKLLTVDLLCHGAPDLWIFRKYVDYLNRKFGNIVTNIKFRDKTFPNNGPYSLRIDFIGRPSYYAPANTDAYFWNFFNGRIFRECCYQCQYSSQARVGDISLGDFWNVHDWTDSFDDYPAVSSVLCNTKKGEEYFNSYSDHFIKEYTSIENLRKCTHAILKPCDSEMDADSKESIRVDYDAWARQYEHKLKIILRKMKYRLLQKL